jgi:membrane protease YdiL (CAAX protease family)
MLLEHFRRHAPELVLAFFGLIFAFVFFAPLNEGVEAFLTAALDVALFVILATFAYLAEDRRPVFRWVAIAWLFALIGGIAAATASIGVVALLPAGALGTGGPSHVMTSEMVLLFLGISMATLVSLLGFSRRFRIWLARYLPFDPDSFVHRIALVTILALILIPPVPLLVAGIPPYLSPQFVELLTGSGDFFADMIQMNVYGLFWILVASLLIAGACVRRTFAGALKRLGLTMPTGREVALAVGAALALVASFYFIDPVLTALVSYLGLPVTDTELVNLLFAGTLTPLGIVATSIAAGFGEEVSIRGLLQPRFGILLPALLFASLHAFQYSWDGLISVFLAGVVFAYIRSYISTTASAITHTVYDLVLFAMLFAGVSI